MAEVVALVGRTQIPGCTAICYGRGDIVPFPLPYLVDVMRCI